MNIHTLQLQNFRRFEDFTFRFHPQFTVLIGDNGFGKTTILDALSIMMSVYLSEFHVEGGRNIRVEEIRAVRYDKKGVITQEPQYPVVLNVSGMLQKEPVQWNLTLNHKGKSIRNAQQLVGYARRHQQAVQTGQDVNLPVLGYYGTGRLWPKLKQIEIGKPGSRLVGYQNCLDPRSDLRLFAKWFKQLELSALQRRQQLGVLEAVRTAIKVSIPEARHFFYDAPNDALIVHLESEGYCLFDNLSDGYRNMVAMVADIAHRAARLNPHLEAEAACETAGVVLIDEIDLHLHPKWQRRVVEDLQRAFPNIQFIATTHSPFILQSLGQGEAIDLTNLNGTMVEMSGEAPRIAEPAPSEAYSNRSPEDIVELVMGVPVPQRSRRYQEMYETAQQYYALLEQGKDADQQEKERIKAKLDKLSAPFSENVAYHAFLEMERMAAGLGKSEKEEK